MVKPIRQNAEHQSLDLGDRICLGGSVGHCPRKLRYFGDPSAVLFLFSLHSHGEDNGRNLGAQQAILLMLRGVLVN